MLFPSEKARDTADWDTPASRATSVEDAYLRLAFVRFAAAEPSVPSTAAGRSGKAAAEPCGAATCIERFAARLDPTDLSFISR
jgi:hypothetical protein